MRLIIEHETHYRFGESAHHSIQYLRLSPRLDPCQSVISWSLTTPGKTFRWTDGFGNLVYVSVQNGIHDELAVQVRGEVDTIDTAGVLPADDGLPPEMFLRATRFTEVDDAIAEFVRPFKERMQDEGVIATLHGLMWTMNQTIAYEPGFTDAESTAAEAFAHGRGVCQDHAHLFIACCRELDIPARYVSGYLLAQSDLQGALSSHAWAEAYVEELGWVSFDPTNSQCATEAYVRLAIAFDYSGAAPVRGVRKGGGIEELTVRVQVLESQ